jgi:hypothetical protein
MPRLEPLLPEKGSRVSRPDLGLARDDEGAALPPGMPSWSIEWRIPFDSPVVTHLGPGRVAKVCPKYR